MKKSHFVLMFILLFAICPTTHAQTNPPCGATITSNTTLYADMDCSNYNGPVLTIGASDITLDLNGHKITAALGQAGVLIPGYRSNINITSSQAIGKIDGEGTAILINGGPNYSINITNLNLSWTGNSTPTGNGIHIGVNGPVHDLFVDGVTSNNRNVGFYAIYGNNHSNITVINSNFNHNNVGMNLATISGLTLSNISLQDNIGYGVWFGSISGSISISAVNVSGSATGIAFCDQPAGFPAIVPGMFNGFGTNSEASINIYAQGGGGTSGLTISGVDLSWNGNTTPTGSGIKLSTNGPVSDIMIDNVTARNRNIGFYAVYGYQSSNVTVKNSIFDNNNIGMNLATISGLTLSNISLQDNFGYGVWFGSISGSISISAVNVSGSATGIAFCDQPAGFPEIVPGMFTGFGTNSNAAMLLYAQGGNTTSGITISGVDLSWTGSTTPTGSGINISTNGSITDLVVDGITVSNRAFGFVVSYSPPVNTNIIIRNSSFDGNNQGVTLYHVNGLTLSNLSLQNNSTCGVMFGGMSGTISISNVNVAGSNIGVGFRDQPVGFPSIVPGMFTGFGTNPNAAISLYAQGGGSTTSGITISGVDLSWTGSTTPIGKGIDISTNGPITDLVVDGVIASNRVFGFIVSYSPPVNTNLIIRNSFFDGNNQGVTLYHVSGLTLSNLSLQNNSTCGVMFSGMSGTISISDVNVAGSDIGVGFRDQPAGFPAIVPGMFTGFGTNPNTAISLYAQGSGSTTSGITIAGVDLSWTGSTTPIGKGIDISTNGPITDLVVDGITVSNRAFGFVVSYSPPVNTNFELKNSFFDGNIYGLFLRKINGIILRDNHIAENNVGFQLEAVTGYNMFHNNLCNNSSYHVYGDQAYELWNHTTKQGNYWCLTCSDHGFIPGTSSNRLDITDDYAYGTQDGWLLPPSNPNSEPCNHPPVALCKDVTVSAASGCVADASIDNSSYDPDGDVLTLSQDPSGPYPFGETMVTLTVTDEHGASSTCTGKITVVDDTPPQITCPNNITINNDVGNCTAVVTWAAPTASDNCGTPTVVCNPASGSTFDKGIHTVTCTASDGSNNTAQCTFTVTVNDNENPSITCPSNMIVNPTTLNGTIMNYSAPIGIDNCSGAITIQIAGLASGSTFPIGITTNIFKVTDASGNSNTCSFTVTVKDPSCASNKVYVCHNGNTLCISINALQAHLNHGDKLGECDWYPKYVDASFGLPQQYQLGQNFPNPFNPSTTINYSIPEDVHVILKVYDLYSREVTTLVNVSQRAGMYSVLFDGKDLPSGIYTYRLEAKGTSLTRVMTLLK